MVELGIGRRSPLDRRAARKRDDELEFSSEACIRERRDDSLRRTFHLDADKGYVYMIGRGSGPSVLLVTSGE